MKKILGALLILSSALVADTSSIPFKESLGMRVAYEKQESPVSEKRCHFYFIEQGSAALEQLPKLAFGGIYASSEESAMQTGELLQNRLKCSLFEVDEFKSGNQPMILEKVIPALKEIAKKNPGESLLIVANSDLIKKMSEQLGKKLPNLKEGFLEIDGDENFLY